MLAQLEALSPQEASPGAGNHQEEASAQSTPRNLDAHLRAADDNDVITMTRAEYTAKLAEVEATARAAAQQERRPPRAATQTPVLAPKAPTKRPSHNQHFRRQLVQLLIALCPVYQAGRQPRPGQGRLRSQHHLCRRRKARI